MHDIYIGSPLKKGSIRDTKASEKRLLRDRPCLFSEKDTVSFVTMFVVPEAEGVEIKKAASSGKMEKNKLHAVLRIFLESIQVRTSKCLLLETCTDTRAHTQAE